MNTPHPISVQVCCKIQNFLYWEVVGFFWGRFVGDLNWGFRPHNLILSHVFYSMNFGS